MLVPILETSKKKGEATMTNTNKLKGRIAEMGYTLSSFSEAVGISRPCLRKRINGLADFKVSEIERVCAVLKIEKTDIGDYFFN